MVTSRWWFAVLGGATVGPVLLLVLLAAPPTAITVAAGVGAGYALVFLLTRTRVREGNAAAITLIAATALYAGALTAVEPVLAITQAIAYPIVWTASCGIRQAIIGSGGVALAAGAGFVVSLGTDGTALAQTALTQTLSFGFAVIMGLWITRIAALGDEKARLLDELTAAQSELAALHRDAGITSERARLAREVHDTVAQSLTGLVLLAQRARRSHASGALDDDTLELIETGARDALAETRALVAASAPVELTQGGLSEALSRLAARFERETQIRVEVDAAIGTPLERDAEVVLLRCAQEALANIRKHSGASHAHVEVRTRADAATLVVSDDGRGFPDDWVPGFGLSGLRERLALADGTLEHSSAAGRTALTATIRIGAAG
ncbi:sensor histidine kinase [Homoserinibacter sp. GY 40078]|uniref:sensor histidine kinase n=1 Tax=Homoserinibacter sp. GY 40078 TaxID=2603275 RepID=UPI0011CACD7E|nr:sensor histidine kinase [Homoserinibacter sp. GY 40078]TXK18532.1 sensor histidine kinase [Homoserinibacter sp. GY 40078]